MDNMFFLQKLKQFCRNFLLVHLLVLHWLHFGHETAAQDDLLKTSASVCYDFDGRATIKLACPQPQQLIHVIEVYTGVSRLNTCSPARWDCIVQEGKVDTCNGVNKCTLIGSLQESQRGLYCGKGVITYLHVQYVCTQVELPEHILSSGKANIKNINKNFIAKAEDIAPDETNDETPTRHQLREEGYEASGNIQEVCVSVGAVAGMIVIISIISAVIHKRKQKRRHNQLSRFLQQSMQLDTVPGSSTASTSQ